MGNQFAAAFAKAGYVVQQAGNTSAAAASPEPPAQQGGEIDLSQFTPESLRWGAAAIELIGKATIVQALDRALEEQTRRARDAFDGLIERAIVQKPRFQAQAWRDRLPPLGGSKGVPTFCDRARDVLDAVQSGACEAYAAEQRRNEEAGRGLVWPSINENESQWDYQNRLNEWAADKVEAHLKAAEFDAYSIACKAVEKRERAALVANTKRWEEAVKAFDQTGDYAALEAACKAVGSTILKGDTRWGVHAGEHAAEHARHAWPCVSAGHLDAEGPRVEPPREWLEKQMDVDFLIRCALRAQNAEVDCRPLFRRQLLAALPQTLAPNQVMVYATYAVTHEGLPIPLTKGAGHEQVHEDQPVAVFPTGPSPKGWISVLRIKKAGEGERTRATLYGPEHYKALQTALMSRKGNFDCRLWLKHFGRSPDKGFGRFYFRVQPGHAHWDQMFISVDDKLRDRIEAAKALPDPEDIAGGIPDDIYFLPARLVSKHDKKGHLAWDTDNKTALVPFYQTASWVQMSRRSSGDFISYRDTTTASAWKLSASTNKHSHTAVVAVIAEGQHLDLDTGLRLKCESGKLIEIPGGALKPGEKPGNNT